MIRLLALSVVLVALISCKSSSKMQSENFVVVSAEQQGFIKGMQQEDGRHAGTAYTIVYEAKGDVKIEKLFIDRMQAPFEYFEFEGKNYVSATIYSVDESSYPVNSDLATDFRGLIVYSVGEKTYQQIIRQFEVRDTSVGK